jgi:hypothetical protein
MLIAGCTKNRDLPITIPMTNDVTYRERYVMVLVVTWMALSSGALLYVMFGRWAHQVGQALLP